MAEPTILIITEEQERELWACTFADPCWDQSRTWVHDSERCLGSLVYMVQFHFKKLPMIPCKWGETYERQCSRACHGFGVCSECHDTGRVLDRRWCPDDIRPLGRGDRVQLGVQCYWCGWTERSGCSTMDRGDIEDRLRPLDCDGLGWVPTNVEATVTAVELEVGGGYRVTLSYPEYVQDET